MEFVRWGFVLMSLGMLDRFVSVVFALPTDLAMVPIAAPFIEDGEEGEPMDAIYEYPAVE